MKDPGKSGKINKLDRKVPAIMLAVKDPGKSVEMKTLDCIRSGYYAGRKGSKQIWRSVHLNCN